jgi:hypothetical protein
MDITQEYRGRTNSLLTTKYALTKIGIPQIPIAISVVIQFYWKQSKQTVGPSSQLPGDDSVPGADAGAPLRMAQHSSPASPWRVVEARVLVSLSPAELCNVRARANVTRRALSGLLMRYQPSLGGVVVAHRGGLRLPRQAHARLIGASPFAHVSAVVTLLVFVPRPGDHLRAVVSHVGPDHVGLTLWNTFHVVLSITETGERYLYDPRSRRWRCTASPDGTKDIAVDATVRFGVIALRHTHSGLFHVSATLLDSHGDASEVLGVVPKGVARDNDDISNAGATTGNVKSAIILTDEDDKSDDDMPMAPILNVTPASRTPKSMIRLSSHSHDADFDDALGISGDPSAPRTRRRSVASEKKKKKKKKERKRSSIQPGNEASLPHPSSPPLLDSVATIPEPNANNSSSGVKLSPRLDGNRAKAEVQLEILPDQCPIELSLDISTQKKEKRRKRSKSSADEIHVETSSRKKVKKGKKKKEECLIAL